MKNLILFSTKYGTAEKTADKLKEKLNGETVLLNIKKDKIPDLNLFDNIILGGSIYIGKIQKNLYNFAEKNLDKLLNKKVGLYICSGAHGKEDDKEQFKNAFPEKLFNHAKSKKNFGFILDFEKMNFMEKFIMKKMKGINKTINKISEKDILEMANELV